MFQRIKNVLVASACLALSVAAQSPCSTLSITTTPDPVRAVQTVQIDLNGNLPGTPVIMAVSTNTGATKVNLRSFGTIVLGLQSPFTTTLLGVTDTQGDLQRVLRLPVNMGITRYTQTVSLSATSPGFPPSPLVCLSNVVQVDL